MKLSKGQTFVEFLLVFVVLLIATSGVLLLYQGVWKARYNETKDVSAVLPSTLKGGIAKAHDTSYVK